MLIEKTFQKDGQKLTYYEGGTGKTIVFFHGAGIRALTYKKSLNALAQNFHVFAPDLPGFGKSDMPQATWTFTHYSKFLSAFLESSDINNSIVIGHSLGGRIAMGIAAHSDRVKRLILIDSTPLASYYRNSKYHIPKLFYNTSLEIIKEGSIDYAKVMFDNLLNLKKHNIGYLKLRKVITESLKLDNDDAKSIRIPTLILWGDKDRIIRPKMAYILQKEIKNSQVKIISGNHGWCITQPARLLDEVTKFVD